MSNRVYDILKWTAILALPAIATFTQTICTVWSLPYGDEISTTITALATCLGALLGISNLNYKRG